MRVVAITLAACFLAAGAAYAATSLLDNASGTDGDPVGNLSPVGSIGSDSTSTETGRDDNETTTGDTTTEDGTTEETTTEEDGGQGRGRGRGHGGDDDD